MTHEALEPSDASRLLSMLTLSKTQTQAGRLLSMLTRSETQAAWYLCRVATTTNWLLSMLTSNQAPTIKFNQRNKHEELRTSNSHIINTKRFKGVLGAQRTTSLPIVLEIEIQFARHVTDHVGCHCFLLCNKKGRGGEESWCGWLRTSVIQEAAIATLETSLLPLPVVWPELKFHRKILRVLYSMTSIHWLHND